MGPQAVRRAQTPDLSPPVDEEREAAGDFWSGRLSAARLDQSVPTPLYHQIYLVLRELIRHPDLAPGALLPGEQRLAQLFSVSRITVKRALNELADENLVSRRRGRGTAVVARASIPIVRSSFDNLLESLQQMGLATQVELLDVREVTAGAADVAQRMGVSADTRLQRAVRRRRLEGEPLSYLITYTPQEIAAHFSEEDLAHTAFLTLLERAHATPLEAEQWITAVAAEPKVASALNVSASTPLLKIERIMRDGKGRTVQLVEVYYRPDLFQYHVRMLSSQKV